RMLEEARSGDLPSGLRFDVSTIEAFDAAGEYDVVSSNAALHWVDDHAALIPRLGRALRPGGQLAFQVPAMHDSFSHTTADDLAATEFREDFNGWRRAQPVLAPEAYSR